MTWEVFRLPFGCPVDARQAKGNPRTNMAKPPGALTTNAWANCATSVQIYIDFSKQYETLNFKPSNRYILSLLMLAEETGL